MDPGPSLKTDRRNYLQALRRNRPNYGGNVFKRQQAHRLVQDDSLRDSETEWADQERQAELSPTETDKAAKHADDGAAGERRAPDAGRRRRARLRVPHAARTAREAVAWTFDMPAKDSAATIET
jgi:Domain of unknown function (DUF6745)